MQRLLLYFLLVFFVGSLKAQKSPYANETRAIFVQGEYQFWNYKYFSFGMGYQPINPLLTANRASKKWGFIGYTANYVHAITGSDWGANLQLMVLPSIELIGLGIESNYKSINNINHYGIKPEIGISLWPFSLLWGYNFDFCNTSSGRLNQWELTAGFRYGIFRFKK